MLDTARLLLRPPVPTDTSADVPNTGFNRMLEKCGFLRESNVRQGKMVSVYCDYPIYGLLKSDLT